MVGPADMARLGLADVAWGNHPMAERVVEVTEEIGAEACHG